MGENPKEHEYWLVSIKKGQLIYELSDRETVYMVFNAVMRTVSKFIGDCLVRELRLTWKELEELLIGEYADEGTLIEAMRSLMKLAQLRDKSAGELGVRVEKLATVAFLEEVRNNTIMQAQLADLYVEVLQNECIQHESMMS